MRIVRIRKGQESITQFHGKWCLEWSHSSYFERYCLPCTRSLLFTPPAVCLSLVLKIFSKLYFIIVQSLSDSQFVNKCCVMMIVSSVKLCIGTIPGYGGNLQPCLKLARLKYLSFLDEPPCSSGVTAFTQSNEIVPFLGRPLKKR